jgi:hypothetical protein
MRSNDVNIQPNKSNYEDITSANPIEMTKRISHTDAFM